jgi:transaldolase
MTLIFSEVQSLACADVGAAVISPFVGRVGDWYKKCGRSWDLVEEDPGVRFVRKLKFTLANYDNTEIMGASFRNIDQIIALAGLDLLTISPELLDGLKGVNKSLDLAWLEGSHTPVKNKTSNTLERKNFDELLAGDVMATDKLVEGIKLFQEDSQKFERMILSDDLGKACATKT